MVDTGHNRLAVAKGCCVEAPIEHVKLGGIEIKFRDEIDGSSDIGKLAHQLKKVLSSNVVEYLLTQSSTRKDYGINIKAGSSCYLGYSNHVPSKFQYYFGCGSIETKWKVCPVPSSRAFLIHSSSKPYHWKYDKCNTQVVLEKDNDSHTMEEENLFIISSHRGSITPFQDQEKTVFGYGESPEPCDHLPVDETCCSSQQYLKVNFNLDEICFSL